MNLLKTSKYILSGVLCVSLISACDGSTNTLSLVDVEQKTQLQSNQHPPSIWAEMRDSFQLLDNNETRPEVVAEIKSLQANKEDTYKILQNSAPYISYVYGETQKRGFPGEIALLPIIESEGNPNAKSRVGAKGLWQLMPGTAKILGIKTNDAYDGRKDVVATTRGALAFLTDLHKTFQDDWLLAMAAYNWGPGSVGKAIKSQKKWYTGISFWGLHVPKETQKYVPKVLALAAVVKNPTRYGFELPLTENHTRLKPVQVHSPVELSEVVRTSGTTLADLHDLNPAYKTLGTTTKGAPNTLLVPIAKPELALESNTSISDNPAPNLIPNHNVLNGIRLALSFSALSTAMTLVM